MPRSVEHARPAPPPSPQADRLAQTVRIGFVTATYLPSRNGVATSSALFAQGLRDLGHEVRIFAPVHPAQQPEDGVYRLPSSSWGTPADYPLLLWPSRPVVARLPLFDLDVVHTMHPFLAGQLASLYHRLPIERLKTAKAHRG